MTNQTKQQTGAGHTRGEFYVAKARTINARGREVGAGWDLLMATDCTPEWCNRFAYKRHALDAAARCNANAALATGSATAAKRGVGE